MKIRLAGILFVVMVLALPLRSFGAEAAKLRHAATAYVDSKGGGIKLSEGVGCSEGSSFIVADTGNGRLLRYSFEENSIKGGEEFKIDQLSYPVRVQLGPGGEIFVLDGKQRRIVHLSADGVFKGYLDPTGLPDPSTFVPWSFKIDSAGNVYILDIFSGRVIVLDPSGKYLRHIEFPAKYGFFSDLAVDSQGRIFLLDGVDVMVYSAAKDSKEFSPLTRGLGEYVNFPTCIAVDNKGTIYLADQNGSGIVVIGQDGSFLGRAVVFGWKDGFLRYPAELCVNGKGEIYVADRENSRVQLFTVVK
jgi:sugar lactone lactonase YvrE